VADATERHRSSLPDPGVTVLETLRERVDRLRFTDVPEDARGGHPQLGWVLFECLDERLRPDPVGGFLAGGHLHRSIEKPLDCIRTAPVQGVYRRGPDLGVVVLVRTVDETVEQVLPWLRVEVL
jgi:hypothetical protein